MKNHPESEFNTQVKRGSRMMKPHSVAHCIYCMMKLATRIERGSRCVARRWLGISNDGHFPWQGKSVYMIQRILFSLTEKNDKNSSFLLYPGLNHRFDMGVTYTVNYFFSGRRCSRRQRDVLDDRLHKFQYQPNLVFQTCIYE
jgi:hypothetical protein